MPFTYRLNPCPHCLSNKGGRIQDQTQKNANKFRTERYASCEIKTHKFWDIHLCGRTEEQPCDQRGSYDKTDGDAENRENLPCFVLPLFCPATDEVNRHTSHEKGQKHVFMGRMRLRDSEGHPTVTQEKSIYG